MEPVSIDTPRGPATPVATLALGPHDVAARLGVQFRPVVNDLEPANLALGRLGDGTVVGFAHYPRQGDGVVQLVQFGDRRPRDVLVEVLFDTGLTHDLVRWTALGPGEDERRWARSLSEAYLYILLNTPPDRGGDDEVLDAVVSSAVGQDRVLRSGDLELWVPPEEPPPGREPLDFADYAYPDDPPSALFDAGNWVAIAHSAAAQVQALLAEHQPPYPGWVYVDVLKFLLRMAAAAEEALRFVPAGADLPPVTACWTAQGLDVYRNHLGELRRDNLERNAAAARQAVEDWRRDVGPTVQD